MTVLQRPEQPHIHAPEQNQSDVPLGEIGVDSDQDIGARGLDEHQWMKKAREAYFFSTTYVDSNYRKRWEDSIRAFYNQHSLDSKYNSPLFDKRSRIYRPKTRTIIRKNEAASAAAFFSNMDLLSVSPMNQSNPQQQASAAVMKELIQYRLTTDGGINWFKFVQGGIQDAQTQGSVCAHVHWKYQENGRGEVIADKPAADLVPIENIRFDPAADWMDPIGSSPYVIHLIPMFVGDIKTKMATPDKKTGKPEWREYGDDIILQASENKVDSTRMSRQPGRQDPQSADKKAVSDYEIAWVFRHIHRYEGEDWEFYTLGTQALLSEPRPLNEHVFHGMRPYVLGSFIIETHKVMPSSVPELADGLQQEANEIANQRLDNVKFVLNKRWFVKRGTNADLASIVRNVPGAVTLVDNPETDVKEINWADVTASSYQEQDRLNVDFDELVGNFSPATIQQNAKLQETVGGMAMLKGAASTLTEYGLLTYVWTFLEPVLRQLVKLEQHYETDEVVMSIAAERAQLFQKYGINQMTDELLNEELTLKVNVGMGATDPMTKVQKLIMGTQAYANIVKMGIPGLNTNEVGKEIFGHLGYQDGRRFFSVEDPEKVQLMQQLQMMKMQMMKMAERSGENKLKIAEQNNRTKIVVESMKEHHQNRRTLADHFMAIQQPMTQPAQPGQVSPHTGQIVPQPLPQGNVNV
jgi:hypothetical protein